MKRTKVINNIFSLITLGFAYFNDILVSFKHQICKIFGVFLKA